MAAVDVADLYAALTPRLRAKAHSWLRGRPEDAEDAMQTVWLRMLGHPEIFEDLDATRSYAYVILKHLVIDLYRREAAVTFMEIQEWSAYDGDRYSAVEDADERDALRALKPKERAIAACLAWGYDGREGAAVVGCTEGAYRIRVMRMRKGLDRAVRGGIGLLSTRPQ